MQGLQTCRFKVREHRNDWRCCFCCHVRTATIFFGVWHLMLHVLALSVIAVVLRHPELMIDPNQQNNPDLVMTSKANFLAPGSEVNPPRILPSGMDIETNNIQFSLGEMSDKPITLHNNNMFGRDSFNRRMMDYKDLNVGVVVTFCTFIITLLMVYGAIKGRPTYLMPFFCLQVFDFCISSLTALGYMCYLPDMHRLVADSPRIPFQRELLRLNPQCLSLLILMTFTLAMLVKAYFIGVVWGCYKYLTLRLIATQRTIHYIDTDVQTLLPDYETAVKKFPAPPPSYATATAGDNIPPPPAPPAPRTSDIPPQV